MWSIASGTPSRPQQQWDLIGFGIRAPPRFPWALAQLDTAPREGGPDDGQEEDDRCLGRALPAGAPELRNLGHALIARDTSTQWGYQKLAALVEFAEEHCEVGNPSSVLRTLELFATGAGQWLKVAGGSKAPLVERTLARRPVAEAELMAEFGAFAGYSTTRLAQQLMIRNGGRSSSPYKGPRLISLEGDAVNTWVARHILDLAMLLCYLEIWTGQAKDLIPRIVEEWGERSLAFGLLDYKGSRYHADFGRLEQLDLMAPHGRLVASGTVCPGAPLLLWNLRHHPGVSHASWEVRESPESEVEDWVTVVDFASPSRSSRPRHGQG